MGRHDPFPDVLLQISMSSQIARWFEKLWRSVAPFVPACFPSVSSVAGKRSGFPIVSCARTKPSSSTFLFSNLTFRHAQLGLLEKQNCRIEPGRLSKRNAQQHGCSVQGVFQSRIIQLTKPSCNRALSSSEALKLAGCSRMPSYRMLLPVQVSEPFLRPEA